ncbi:MAG: hypothetical protein Rpha_1623 [Candidatus Ruthia sp. Apha_13_S6]|nr:hypothetical protein [Candidatus Ruthia sp. Apha_13_S6]
MGRFGAVLDLLMFKHQFWLKIHNETFLQVFTTTDKRPTVGICIFYVYGYIY